jgi:outer membrane receptor for ferrienterochelin and colicins
MNLFHGSKIIFHLLKKKGRIFISIFSFSLLVIKNFAQQTTDTTTAKRLAEVIVTATRTERQLSALPVPATLV